MHQARRPQWVADMLQDTTAAAAAATDDLDFGDLVSRHLPRLRKRAVRMCRSEADADDVVQEALLRALRGRHQLRSPERAGGWLLTIVSSTVIDRARRRRSRPQEVELAVEPAAAPDDADDPPPWHALSIDDVVAAVAALPDDVRDTYRMFALERRDYASIAATLGIPRATVGTRIHRARRHLRATLAAQMAQAAAAQATRAA
jgi:RNA polymerase sigma-70 factor (ECF subfamily)